MIELIKIALFNINSTVTTTIFTFLIFEIFHIQNNLSLYTSERNKQALFSLVKLWNPMIPPFLIKFTIFNLKNRKG